MSERSAFQRFLSELRRRHVPETAAIYMVAAWAAIQFADVVVPNLGWSEGIITAVIVAAAIGLPVALVLAWVFEWGPDGLHRTPGEGRPEVGRTGGPARATSGPWVTAMAVLVVGIASALAVAVVLDHADGDDLPVDRTVPAPPAPGGVPGRGERADRSPTPEESFLRDLPPGIMSPEFADSIAALVGDLSDLERLEGMAELRRLGERLGPERRSLLIAVPASWMVGPGTEPLAVGDTLRVQGVARDSAGVAAVLVDGHVVARSEEETDPTLPFTAALVGTGSEGLRTVTITVRTRDGREIEGEYRIQQLPEG